MLFLVMVVGMCPIGEAAAEITVVIRRFDSFLVRNRPFAPRGSDA